MSTGGQRGVRLRFLRIVVARYTGALLALAAGLRPRPRLARAGPSDPPAITAAGLALEAGPAADAAPLEPPVFDEGTPAARSAPRARFGRAGLERGGERAVVVARASRRP